MFVVFSTLAIGACSGNAPSEKLAIGLIDDAIAAVDEHFGGSSDFYEINATSDGVNLFVSTTIDGGTAGVVQARYTQDDGLVVSDEAVPSDGPVFAGTSVDFDPQTVVGRAIGQLSTARPRVFIITAAGSGEQSATQGQVGSGGVSYRLVLESQRGGRLVVFLAGDGTILGSDFLE